MVVCIYGAASSNIDKKYTDGVYELSVELAKSGNSLIFGSGSTGIMGAAASGFKDGGGYVHGVIPKFFEENNYEGIFYQADEITRTDTMAERKQLMEDGCDAFIIAPGGIGTYEEFYEALTLKQLGRHKKAIVIFNIDGFYDDLMKFTYKAMEQGFINSECKELFKVCNTKEEVIKYINNYSTDTIKWNRLKRN